MTAVIIKDSHPRQKNFSKKGNKITGNILIPQANAINIPTIINRCFK